MATVMNRLLPFAANRNRWDIFYEVDFFHFFFFFSTLRNSYAHKCLHFVHSIPYVQRERKEFGNIISNFKTRLEPNNKTNLESYILRGRESYGFRASHVQTRPKTLNIIGTPAKYFNLGSMANRVTRDLLSMIIASV